MWLLFMSSQIERLLSPIREKKNKKRRRGGKSKKKEKTKANLRKKRQKLFSRFLYLINEPIKGSSTIYRSEPNI